jgi:ketosteroid isomerase-like protein
MRVEMADANSRAEEEIKKLAHDWLDAIRRRDAHSLDRILHDDFIISGWQPEGRLADKPFYMEDALRPVDIEEGFYRYDRWKIRVYGITAVVHCTLEIRAVVQGHQWGGEVVITDVWLRDGDSWRVLTRHTTPFVRPGAQESAS